MKDNWLTKNIRPLSLAYMIFVFTILVIVDSSTGLFTVKEIYITVFETVLVTMILAFFGSRGLEKIKLNEKDKDD